MTTEEKTYCIEIEIVANDGTPDWMQYSGWLDLPVIEQYLKNYKEKYYLANLRIKERIVVNTITYNVIE